VSIDELGLRLQGDLRAMDAEALIVALRAILQLLGIPPADDGHARPIWALSTLREGSAIVAVRPGGVVTQEATDRMRVIIRGIEQLDRRAGEPEGWQPADLEHLLSLSRVLGMTGVAGVQLTMDGGRRRVDLAGGILDHARASLSEGSPSIGSVRGHLDTYSGRGSRPTVGLRDEVTGRAVRIRFPDYLRESMLAALERDVVIWGEVRRNAQGHKTSVVAEGIQVIERGIPEPTEHMVGMFGPEWTDGQDAVEFTHRQRRE
jgi:hypothetical protein